MREKMVQRFLFIFLAILLLTHPPIDAQESASQEGLELAIQKSLRQASTGARCLQTDDDLDAVSARAVQSDDLGYTTYAVKVLDQGAEEIYSYWYNENVQLISEEAAFQARASAYEAKYGYLSRDLYRRIHNSEIDSQTTIPVAIWAEQSVGADTIVTPGPYKIYLPLVVGGMESPIEQIRQFLSTRGYNAEYVSEEAPVVYASITADVISELQSEDYVAAIYEQGEGHLTMDSAARTSAAPWTWERGITGEGVKIAVLENDGVAFDNPYLNGSQYCIGWWKRIGSHATHVAGVAAADHSEYRGIAYGAEVLSANALTLLEVNVVAASDWAINAGADIINASFGTTCRGTNITSYDKYFDWVVWNKRRTVTISAGNVRPRCSHNHNVSSPGKAYNVITVGAKDDQNTAATESDTKDDQFSDFSCYVDPETASENRLKPEVVAVGERITTMSPSSPWIGSDEVAGTSFSAPIVAGEAALMMQRATWLRDSPEAVKAGIMATARWTSLKDDEDPNEQASIDKMGVGAIDTTAADNSLINGRIQELRLQENDFTNDHYDVSFEVTVPERIRVIIVWSSHLSRVRITNWILHDRLESDFDLTVRAPDGQVFGSYADEANYEIVEFMAPQTGTYRARIHLSRWDDSSQEEPVGFSWYSGPPLP
jgi:subtilisin family serine protease